MRTDAAVALTLALAVPPRIAVAQTSVASASAAQVAAESSVVVTPGAQYRAGHLRRMLLGADYRDLWTTPITVGVLDLRATAGGLHPTQRGGGEQTRSLRFDGADGREYVFRVLDKDAARGLPPELRQGVVAGIVQDQVAAFHPAAPLVVARLLDATGIRHAHPRLLMMPDDAALGEFRADFANRLGTFEERAGEHFDETPDSAGATKVIGSEAMFERMRTTPGTVVDTRAFLAARLFDVLVGDRDRHRDQWRWAAFDGPNGPRWEPVPRDRDMAFVKNDGLIIAITRRSYPQLVTFGDRYPSMLGLTWNGREIDRRLLVGLDRAAWDSTARALQAQLTDSVIDDAIGAMPAELRALSAAELRRTLLRRRERLPRAAAEYYALLAGEVDLRGTDSADVVAITRLPGGAVDVAISAAAPGATTPYQRRRFLPHETREVRLYLFGGDDRVIVRGEGGRGIGVRIVGGDGDDLVIDSTSGARSLRFHDSSGDDRSTGAHRIRIDRRAYTPPPTRRPQDPPRDWGAESGPAPWVSYAPDVGLFVGAGRTRTRYGFRSDPYRSRLTIQGGWAFEARRPRAQVTGVLRRENSRDFASLEARASGIEVVRFHGFGNETVLDRPARYYHVFQTQYRVEPGYVRSLGAGLTATFGAVAQLTNSDARAGTLLGAVRPYGAGRFGELGARAGVVVDRRDREVAATRGVYAGAGTSVYPPVWSVTRAFGETHGSAAAYLPIPIARSAMRAPVLAVRAGGRRLWGEFPFHESAFVGGGSTLRGWGEQRFAGRAALFGNAELRVPLGRVLLLVPNDVGVFGLADAGRVYVSGERSGAWHRAFGGGIWIAPVRPTHTISLAVARGDERTGVYLRSGFLF